MRYTVNIVAQQKRGSKAGIKVTGFLTFKTSSMLMCQSGRKNPSCTSFVKLLNNFLWVKTSSMWIDEVLTQRQFV